MTHTHTQVLLLEANIDQAKKAGAAQAVEVMTMLKDKAGKSPRSIPCLPGAFLPLSEQGQGPGWQVWCGSGRLTGRGLEGGHDCFCLQAHARTHHH
jgi:hypothetical protein